jgi:DNA polymerase III delta prime subunit
MSETASFITKYKPYYIKDFCNSDIGNESSSDADLLPILNTLFEIDDLNILLLGNASSGKTTLIYAIIRHYYGLEKNSPLPENNILFINNLKEQGIQYFRNEMKTFCQSHSLIYGKKKLLIIDDIDYINEQSQQVFRNYIDKYSHNIHFISVCSNIQKVIESIQSRLHIIRIRPPSNQYITNIMNHIIEKENLEVDSESRQYLLMLSNHSVRTMLNHLEKIYIVREPITLELCKKICSNISFQQFETYISSLKEGDLNAAIQLLLEIHDYGYSVIDILDYFFTFVKYTGLLTEEEKYRIIPYLCKYISIFHNIHEDSIELALFTNNLLTIFENLVENAPL